MSEKVILIIKVANQGSVDQKIECDLDWTILHLKEEISQCHPTKPTVGEQRLIYSGQLLQDSVTLRTILRHPSSDNNEFIIHMVCSTTRTLPVNRFDNSNVATSSHSPGSANSGSETENNTEGLRHRSVPSEQQIPALGVQQGFDTSVYSTLPQFPLGPQAVNDPIQQMAIMQQMYAQYMASYMQYIQYGGSERLFQDQNSGASPSSSSSTNANADDLDNNGIIPPQNPNIEQEQRNAQGRLNQGRGPADEVEEEMVARDWLDYLYFGSRMLILLSIVYFYSTLTRFIIVSGISIFIYMYQRGGARARRDRGGDQQQEQGDQPQGQNANNEGGPNRAQPVADAPLQPGPEEVANRDGGAGSNALQEAALRDGNTRNDFDNVNEGERGRREENPESNEVGNDQPPILSPTREEVTPPQPSLLALSWTFLTTFFTSLIPEQHQIV
ncbi:UNVERIFIED_CONTAM: hypothetical protein RMT77_016392 [Armadillidium vulgare]